MFLFLSVVQAIIAAALVTVVLMQRSEGGGLGLGGGGSPTGLMSARGAADFMTRATTVLAVLFVGLSIVLAALAVGSSSGRTIDTSLDRSVPGVPQNPTSDLIGDTAGPSAAAQTEAASADGAAAPTENPAR